MCESLHLQREFLAGRVFVLVAFGSFSFVVVGGPAAECGATMTGPSRE